MDIFDQIRNNTLIICLDKYKSKIESQIMSKNKLLLVKVMGEKEIFERLFFSSSLKTRAYLYLKKNYALSLTSKIINYLYFIDENKDYSYSKLNNLKELKKELFANNLLTKEANFKHYLEDKDIIFYGYPFLKKETNFLLNEIKKFNPNIKILNENKTSNLKVKELETIDEEINYVFYKISKLIEDKVDINKIKIVNVNQEYYFYLKRIAKNYNLNLNMPSLTTLYSLPLTSIFIDMLKEKDKEEVINCLLETYPQYQSYINEYIQVLNELSFLDKLDLDLLEELLKNKKIKNKTYSNSIEVIDISKMEERNYNFVLNASYNSLPKLKKDEEYLNDKEKAELNISSSEDINAFNNALTLSLLNNSNPYLITFKKESHFAKYVISDLFTKEQIKHVDFLNIYDELISYSPSEDKLLLASLKDGKIENEYLDILQNSYNQDYACYDNSFKKLDEMSLKKILEKDIRISYSSLSDYYKCSFKYLYKNILKISTFERNNNTIIGTIFHNLIDKCLTASLDLKSLYEKEIKSYETFNKIELSNYEKLILNNLLPYLTVVTNFVKDFDGTTKFNNYQYEKTFNFLKNKNGKDFIIKGSIDKLMYNDDRSGVVLIDMKSGDEKIEEELFSYGLSLQLPFYIYSLKHLEEFKDSKVVGYYIHKILDSKNNYSSYRLNGYSLNEEILSEFDPTLKKSSFVAGLELNKEGEKKYPKRYKSKEEIDNLVILVEEKIDEMINGIIQGDFKINPKIIDNDKDTCAFCEFKHICHLQNKDYIHIKTTETEEK